MDDERDVGIGTALFAAANQRKGSGTPDFHAVYIKAGLRQTGRRRAVRSGFFLAAAMALGLFVPAFLKVDRLLNGPDSYRFLISDLSSRTVSDVSWENNFFAVESEPAETPLGEFLDDLWNL